MEKNKEDNVVVEQQTTKIETPNRDKLLKGLQKRVELAAVENADLHAVGDLGVQRRGHHVVLADGDPVLLEHLPCRSSHLPRKIRHLDEAVSALDVLVQAQILRLPQ